jgi:superfamily II DNA or RNA helicase
LSRNNTIVYSLQRVEGLEIIIPTAFICDVDNYDRPGYIQAMALPETVSSYGLDLENSIHQQLLEICLELQPVQLEKTINKNKKKHEKLSVLFSDSHTRNVLQVLIDKKLVKFLEVIKENRCYLCYQLQRKIKAYDILLTYFDGSAIPRLQFTKTQTGVRYELKLIVGDQLILPYVADIIILSNMPAMICINNVVMPLEFVNASKIKPFIKNESVFVPEKLVKNYFEQFVTDVMGKVEIEAEGFQIIKQTVVKRQTLFFVFDIFENNWFVDIRFHYEGFTFSASEPGKRKTKLHFEDLGEIVVFECIRNQEAEQTIFDVLKSLGFNHHHNQRFFFGSSLYAIFERVNECKDLLSNYFDIEKPEIDRKNIDFANWEIRPNFRLINDWFDLHGTIQIGNDYYPFTSLFKNIREENRFFKLKNGSFVIIPESIMAKFSQIAKYATETSGNWKLSKSHYMLLDDDKVRTQQSLLTPAYDLEYEASPFLKASLRPYQVEGVKWLIRHRINGLGACLADDMGLGKTLQMIAALLDAKENKKSDHGKDQSIQLDLFGEIQTTGRKSLGALIVLPASLVFNWYSELRKFAPSLQVFQYIGSGRRNVKNTILTFDVILTTYQTLVSDIEIFKPIHFHYIVLDESQQIRNKNSLTFRTVHQLSADHRVSISGTPIENSLSDLWSQMEFINPSVLGSFSFFKENFIIPIEKRKDSETILELKKLVDPYILRRTKEQVAKDLPKLTEVIHYSEMSDCQSKTYEREKSAARNFLAGLDKENTHFRFHVLSSLMKLRQSANHPVLSDQKYQGDSGKYDDVKDQIKTIVLSGHKVLVFSSFVGHLKLYAEWLESENINFVQLTGSSDSQERKNAVELFQNESRMQVFLLSIKAGGTGLNLTAADYVFILDPWWNPFVEKQAIARAHRIGRTQNVMVKRFISRGTIEEKILTLQLHKKSLSEDILEINDIPALADGELAELI